MRYLALMLLLIIILLLSLFSSPNSINASSLHTINVNGELVNFEEGTFIEKGRIFVPIRFVTEKAGSSVEWDNEKRTVTIKTPHEDALVFEIDKQEIIINHKKFIMDVAPKIKNSRTYLPIRHVSELIHAEVGWDANTNTANVKTKQLYEIKSGDTLSKVANRTGVNLYELKRRNGLTTDQLYVGDKLKTIIPKFFQYNDDFNLLSRLIEAESEAEPFKGKLAVANVVMNRVTDNQFPNSISSVIYQRNQFTPVKNGRINEVIPSKDSLLAAKKAMNGENIETRALFFFNPLKTNNVFLSNRTIITQIGNHRFTY